MRRCGEVALPRKIGGMTTSHGSLPTQRHDVRTSLRRRLVAPLLVPALALGGAGALLGFTTSPGRIGAGTDDVAIPGVRGTGSGGGFSRVSASPGPTELALARKAGGPTPEYP